MDFTGANLKLPANSDANSYMILNCEGMRASGLTLPTAQSGVADLRRAAIGVLETPAATLGLRTRLAGLTYTDLDPDPDPPVKQRLRWLERDPDGYHPQPYEQLAAYYRANGHDREARRVLLAKRRVHRDHASNAGLDGPWKQLVAGLRRIPGLIIDALAGYGYAPGRAFAWLITTLVFGTLLLYSATPATPTNDQAVNALLLALDTIMPTSPLGIRQAVNLTGSAYVIAIILQGFGFALSLAVLPALTRILARTDK